jgi:hypothetical protein
MGTKALRHAGRLVAIAVLSGVSPGVVAGQDTGVGVSVQGAAGTHLNAGGDTQSIGLGISFGKRFAVGLNAERSHVPTDVTFFPDGYSATRGGSTRLVSGEFRYFPITYKRVSPYVLVTFGRGVSRPNVNRYFPDRVTHDVTLQGPGFGARVRVTEHLSAFADIRFLFQSRRGEPDAGGFAPVRAGLAWRF